MSVTITELTQGMRFASDAMDHVESVSLGLWIGAGTRQEHPEKNGVAHLLEHMTFKGTPSRNALAIACAIEDVGGYMNAHTGREQTAFYFRVLANHWPLAMEMLADIVQNSLFDEEELARERHVIMQEIGESEDDPDDVIFDHLQEVAFPDQAMGRPVLGRQDIVRQIGRADLIQYRQVNYHSQNMVIVTSGNLRHDEMANRAESLFSPFAPNGIGEERARYRGGEWRANRKLEQIHIACAYEGVPYRDPDYYAAAVLAQILGGGMSSRLFQEIREKRGLAYTIGAFSSSFLDTGLFGVYAGTSTASASEMMAVVAGEIHSLDRTLTEEELRRAKQQLKAAILISREKSSSRCEQLANQLLVFGSPIPATEIAARIDSVQKADILRASRRIFTSAPSLAVLGPGAEKLRMAGMT